MKAGRADGSACDSLTRCGMYRCATLYKALTVICRQRQIQLQLTVTPQRSEAGKAASCLDQFAP
jgi:hypothetical protein